MRRRTEGAVTCGVGAAMPLFIFSSPLQRMSSASEAWRSSQHLHVPHGRRQMSWAFGGTHGRVAERTRLFPEGKYSGKCKAIRPI